MNTTLGRSNLIVLGIEYNYIGELPCEQCDRGFKRMKYSATETAQELNIFHKTSGAEKKIPNDTEKIGKRFSRERKEGKKIQMRRCNQL